MLFHVPPAWAHPVAGSEEYEPEELFVHEVPFHHWPEGQLVADELPVEPDVVPLVEPEVLRLTHAVPFQYWVELQDDHTEVPAEELGILQYIAVVSQVPPADAHPACASAEE